MDDEVNDDHGDHNDHTRASLVTIRLCGPSQSECGYCHGKRASMVQKSPQESSVTAMGLWMEAAEKLASSSSSATLLQQQQQQQQQHRQQLQQQTALYEQFVCRGWRRSGRYLYKPDNWASCCPAFTIRLKVQQFAPTKSQRRVVQKMKRLLEPTTRRQATQHAPSRKQQVVFNRSVIMESGVVTLLQDWTREILEKYWMDHIKSYDQSSSLPLPSWWNDIMPVTFKVLPNQNTKKPNKQEKQHEQLSTTSPQQKKRPIAALAGSNPTTMVTDDDDDQRQQHQSHQQHQHILSTTICAALAGRSRGQIRRDDVSIHVADALQRQWDVYVTTTSQNDRIENLVLIRKIESNIKSGHVLVHLVVIDNVGDNNKHEQKSNDRTGSIHVGDQDMADSDKNQKHGKHSNSQSNKVKDDVDDEDAFASWWKTEAVLRQGCWGWSQKKQQRPPQSSQTHQLQVSTMSAWDSALDPDVFRLYTLYQHEVHNESDVLAHEYSSADSGDVDERDNENSNDSNQEHDHGNTSAGDEQTGDEEWILQSKTMMEAAFLRHCTSHPRRQECIRKAYESFVHFLVDTPFSNDIPEPQESNFFSKAETRGDNLRYPPGSYHQHYRIDGALVAVGVVDLLPQGLSSVYLFYHPSFSHRHVALGKYCSWREIEFAQQCQVPYYYLGYYIESCPKMRYKAEYQPSQLLCPVTYQWVDAKVAQSIIQANSPIHHCCQLFYPPAPRLSSKLTLFESSRDSHPLDKRELFNFCHPQPSESVNAILNSILLDVGLPKTVTLGMLQAAGQDIVRPLLQALYNELNSQIVEHCIVKLV